jgi:bacteriocin-like protein
MTHIQMTDGNSSDLGLSEELANEEPTDEELTDEELQAIDGGALGAVGGGAVSILDNVFHSEPIDWRSAGAGAVGGAIGGAAGGPWGAGLAGTD